MGFVPPRSNNQQNSQTKKRQRAQSTAHSSITGATLADKQYHELSKFADTSKPVSIEDSSGAQGAIDSAMGLVRGYWTRASGSSEPQQSGTAVDLEKGSSQQTSPDTYTSTYQTTNPPGGFPIPHHFENPPGYQAVQPPWEADGGRTRSREHFFEQALQGQINSLAKENDRLKQELEAQREVTIAREGMFGKNVSEMETKVKNYETELTGLRDEIAVLHQEKDVVTRNLESCKERIFNLQPVQGLSDTQLVGKYRQLCEGIDNWAETHFGDLERFILNLRKAPTPEEPQTANVVKTSLVKDDLTLVRNYPAAEIPMFQSLISRHIWTHLLLRDRIFPGLDGPTEECLQDVITGMSTLKPAKDSEAIEMWRVDLQRTLSALPSRREKRKAELKKIAGGITKCLEDWGSADRQYGVAKAMACKLVEDAAELATNIRQSMDWYRFEFTFHPTPNNRETLIGPEDLNRYRVIDSSNGSLLPASASARPSRDGKVGNILFVVHPTLLRKSVGSDERVQLVKETVVVDFDRPVYRETKSKAFQGT